MQTIKTQLLSKTGRSNKKRDQNDLIKSCEGSRYQDKSNTKAKILLYNQRSPAERGSGLFKGPLSCSQLCRWSLIAISVISCCLISAFAGAENISLNFQKSSCSAFLEEVPLRIVVEKVRKETGIWVKAPESMLDERVSVQFENLSILEGLKRIFREMNYSFLHDRDNNLIGAFVFAKSNKIGSAISSDELNEQMVSAAFEGKTADVMALLARGADVNAEGEYSGWTPLMLAARKGDTQLVRLLIAHGADLNAKSRVRSRTALMEAARNRKVDTLKLLLAANPDVDAVDWEGYTVLMFAAVSGQLDIVNALIAQEADVNVKNKVGSSALMMASGYPKVQKILKEAGAME